MPRVHLIAYQEQDGSVPLMGWFESLPRKALDKCRVRLRRLSELGHELRRPEADYLTNDIHELRAKHRNVNYRMLYFFHGGNAVVVSHGFSKQQAKVSKSEIALALRRKSAFESSPPHHTYEGEVA